MDSNTEKFMSAIRNILISNAVGLAGAALVGLVVKAVQESQKTTATAHRMGGYEYKVDCFYPDEVIKPGKHSKCFDDRGDAFDYAMDLAKKSPEFRVIIFRQDNNGELLAFRTIEARMHISADLDKAKRVQRKTTEELLETVARLAARIEQNEEGRLCDECDNVIDAEYDGVGDHPNH